jgi:hypothetical protein
MHLLKRFGYYFGGFAIGLVLLAFFLNGKKASCDYSPDARVIKNIRLKTLTYSNNAVLETNQLRLDSAQINTLIKKADINFSKSESRKKPCGIYVLESSLDKKDYLLTIENCNTKATLLKAELEN